MDWETEHNYSAIVALFQPDRILLFEQNLVMNTQII